MSEVHGVVFRGVIRVSGDRRVWCPKTRTSRTVPGPHLIYSRPYDTKGPAKAAVTTMRKNNSRRFLEGWVEYSTEWKMLDED